MINELRMILDDPESIDTLSNFGYIIERIYFNAYNGKRATKFRQTEIPDYVKTMLKGLGFVLMETDIAVAVIVPEVKWLRVESAIREMVFKYGKPFVEDFGDLNKERFNKKHDGIVKIYNKIPYYVPASKIAELLVDEFTVYILDCIPKDTNSEVIELELLEMIYLAFSGEFQNKITKEDLIERIDWNWIFENYPKPV